MVPRRQVRVNNLRLRDHRAWVLSGLMLVVAGVFTCGVSLEKSKAFDPLIDGVLGLLTWWLPAAVGWMAVLSTKRRRPDIMLSAGALFLQAVGSTYYILQSAAGKDVPFPSLADVGYVGFYLLMLAALAVIVRDRQRAAAWPVLLDSIVGALGAAAILTVLMEPVLSSALNGSPSLEAALGAAYPLVGMVLVAAAVGITATDWQAAGKGWGLLVLGLIVYTAGNVVYSLQELNNLYVLGTPLDGTWAVGSALIASWIVFQGCPRGANKSRRRAAVPVQAVPALATIAALGVLTLASQQRVLSLAVGLAVLTMALAASPQLFRQRVRISDANRQARTDDLTGLANRRALYSDVPRRMTANPDRPSALLLLDLNNFKQINDGLGHAVGDKLLIQVAARLSRHLRAVDLVARIGGDEFVIHIDSCAPGEAQMVALKLREALAHPYNLDGIIVHVSVSIGISCYPEQGRELDVLLRKADQAMYSAKSTHSGYALYADNATDTVPTHLHSVQALNEALVHDQLILHFQPKIDLGTGGVRGVEALVRWEHPARGLLQPDEFLRRFEEAGLMPALTSVVLGKALDQAAVWAAKGKPLSVAVNLPASSVMDSSLPGQIETLTMARGLPPSVLVLEITEDVLVTDRARANAILAALRDMGVRIAVDDFGKGYSSLSYLRELPIDELKLDKSFILAMLDDARTMALVVSTIDLAHSLGMEMTAEGVEDADAYRALSEYGCDLAQGYYMSKPVPAAELDTWLSLRMPYSYNDDVRVHGFGEVEEGALSVT